MCSETLERVIDTKKAGRFKEYMSEDSEENNLVVVEKRFSGDAMISSSSRKALRHLQAKINSTRKKSDRSRICNTHTEQNETDQVDDSDRNFIAEYEEWKRQVLHG